MWWRCTCTLRSFSLNKHTDRYTDRHIDRHTDRFEWNYYLSAHADIKNCFLSFLFGFEKSLCYFFLDYNFRCRWDGNPPDGIPDIRRPTTTVTFPWLRGGIHNKTFSCFHFCLENETGFDTSLQFAKLLLFLVKLNFFTKGSSGNKFFLFGVEHWYPCSGLLMASALDLKIPRLCALSPLREILLRVTSECDTC